MYESLIRPVLFALSAGDAERAHILAIKAMKTIQHSPVLLRLVAKMYQPRNPVPVEVCGIKFPHYLGLAAGFDKNCEVLPFLEAAGFGFVEVGSIVPQPQPGSPRPRMFRLKKHRALINRLGFNSAGRAVAKDNLLRAVGRYKIPVGVSIGPNLKTIKDPEPVARDCIKVLEAVGIFASYAVINVSSPNTQNLRDLQAAARLREIIEPVWEALHHISQLNCKEIPLFVKFTADMDTEELRLAAETARASGVVGFVMSNTTIDKSSIAEHRFSGEAGGLSGPSLHKRAVAGVQLLRQIDSEAPIIGVGGIEDYDGGQRMLDAGATLLELYTAMIYQGLAVISRVLEKK